MRVGADSGGTFTDVVLGDGRIRKVPSTPDDPGEAIRSAMGSLGADDVEVLAHGTTVATNALLEGTIARVALYTTEGFGDVIEIARQDRPSLYDPFVDRPEALVGRPDRLEVTERTEADGTVSVAVDAGAVADPDPGVDVVAVCLLHSDLNPANEDSLATELRDRGWDVTASAEVSPEFREYERSVTTVLNAALRPVCGQYLRDLAPVAQEVVVMTSAGTLVEVERAVEVPAALLLSGPAAGAAAAAVVAESCGYPDALAFDMGGTSTDVCLILGGEPEMAAQQIVGGYPVRLPALGVHTVGAGGGSIAAIDPGGALVVGPRSAGAVPGPVCYGRGGTQPTVTDANLLLGRIPTEAPFSGLGRLDIDATRHAMGAAGMDPGGVVSVVNATMVEALRRVSLRRGVDPRSLALVAFGGAGPLHACELADELGVSTVIVPAMAGVLSAVGLLTSPRGVELVRSWPAPLEHSGIEELARELVVSASRVLDASPASAGGREVTISYDCRYAGQSHELRVSSVSGFHDEHRRVNGYDRPQDPVEIISVRAAVTAPAPMSMRDLAPAGQARPGSGARGPLDPVQGPRVVSRDDCTIWVPDGWEGQAGPLGALVLHRVGSGV